MGVLLPVGTRKGLFLLRSDDRQSWDVEGPLLSGLFLVATTSALASVWMLYRDRPR